MKTIEGILSLAENICKTPGVKQSQSDKNKLRIASRFAIDAVQRWIPIEEDMPEVNTYGFSEMVITKWDCNSTSVVIQQCYRKKNGEKRWCDFETHSLWRPIEIK